MPNPYGEWTPDPLAPSGYRWRRHDEQPATTMLPAVTPNRTVEYAGHTDHQLEHDDLDVVEPDQLPSYDHVDSRTIVDTGGPA